MPQVINNPITVYKYNELTPDAQDTARMQHGDAMTMDHWWSECVLDGFREMLQALGFVNPKRADDPNYIKFSYQLLGQGYGLSFTGEYEYCAKATKKLSGYTNNTEILELAAELDRLQHEQPGDEPISVSITRNRLSRESHEGSVCITAYDSEGEECDELTEALKDRFRWVMQEFYTILESEYQHLYSEEAMQEYIENESPVFTQDGTEFIQ
tara:strand:+ start:736 stop:1371 length:636 start_codon:yes stop_codon:yes gene_type:complete